MNKNELRIKYKKMRKSISLNDKESFDKIIFNKIIELTEYKKSNLILIYVSLQDEVDTIELIKYSLNIGKKIAVPKCVQGEINFIEINLIKDLKTGNFGILEPINNNYINDFSNSICIIPGIAFDKNKHRIGYGKGYYDKFLENYEGFKIGLTYSNCICDKIFSEPTDIKMDIVITD